MAEISSGKGADVYVGGRSAVERNEMVIGFVVTPKVRRIGSFQKCKALDIELLPRDISSLHVIENSEFEYHLA